MTSIAPSSTFANSAALHRRMIVAPRLILNSSLFTGGTTHAFPSTLASDLLSGSGPAVRRLLPAGTRADRACRGAGLGVFLVHRAPLPALRRSHAQPGCDHVCGRGAHLADSSGLRDLDFALAPSGGGRRLCSLRPRDCKMKGRMQSKA